MSTSARMGKKGSANSSGKLETKVPAPALDRSLMSSILKHRQEAFEKAKSQDWSPEPGTKCIVRGLPLDIRTFTDKDTNQLEVLIPVTGTIVGVLEGDDSIIGRKFKIGVFTTRESQIWKLRKFFLARVLGELSGNLELDLKEAGETWCGDEGLYVVETTENGEYINSTIVGQPTEDQCEACEACVALDSSDESDADAGDEEPEDEADVSSEDEDEEFEETPAPKSRSVAKLKTVPRTSRVRGKVQRNRR